MTDRILHCIMLLGERMLVSGAEVHRVEESVMRLCKAYGAVRADVYTTISNMIITVETEDGRYLTQTCRIQSTGTDIMRLHELNDLFRRSAAHPPQEEDLLWELERIDAMRTYPRWLQVLSYAAIAGSFTIFFGGLSWAELLISFVIGGTVGVIAQLTAGMAFNKALDRFLCSLAACSLTFLAMRLGWVESGDKIIIGNIMSLIPGIGLTNALRDLFTGDVITGILRSIEAVLLAFSIAAGYIIAVFLLGGGLA